MIQKRDAPLVGHLVIYVGGYKMHQNNLWHGISQDGKHYLVPDKVMPVEDMARFLGVTRFLGVILRGQI